MSILQHSSTFKNPYLIVVKTTKLIQKVLEIVPGI